MAHQVLRREHGSLRETSIDILIDPKSENLDSAIRDILRIGREVIGLVRYGRIESIEVRDRFAVVRATASLGGGRRAMAIRMIRAEDEWQFRGCSFDKEARKRTPVP
jgi:hypothetical protein